VVPFEKCRRRRRGQGVLRRWQGMGMVGRERCREMERADWQERGKREEDGRDPMLEMTMTMTTKASE
jgi:hypothetical protein